MIDRPLVPCPLLLKSLHMCHRHMGHFGRNFAKMFPTVARKHGQRMLRMELVLEIHKRITVENF